MRDYSFTLDEFCNALGPAPFVQGRSLALWLDACDRSSYFHSSFALCCKRSFEIDDSLSSGNYYSKLIRLLRNSDPTGSNSSKGPRDDSDHPCQLWQKNLITRSDRLAGLYGRAPWKTSASSREYIDAFLTSVHKPLFSFFEESTGHLRELHSYLQEALNTLDITCFTPVCLIQSSDRLQQNSTAMVCFCRANQFNIVYFLPSLNPDDIRALARNIQPNCSKYFFHLLQVMIYFFAQACYGALPTYIPRSIQDRPVSVPLSVAKTWLHYDSVSKLHHSYVPVDTTGSDITKLTSDRALLSDDPSALWREMGYSITKVPSFSERPYNIAKDAPAKDSVIPGFVNQYEPPLSVRYLYEELSAHPETAFAYFFAIQCILYPYMTYRTNSRTYRNYDKAPFFILDGSAEEFQDSAFDFVSRLPVCELFFISSYQRISKSVITNRLGYHRIAFIIFEGETRRLTLKQCQLIACSSQTVFLVNADVPPEWPLCARLPLQQIQNHLYTAYELDPLEKDLLSATNSEWYRLASYPYIQQARHLQPLWNKFTKLRDPAFKELLKPCAQLLADARNMDDWLRQKPLEINNSERFNAWYMKCPYDGYEFSDPNQYIDALLKRFRVLRSRYKHQLQLLRDSLPNLALSNNNIPPASLSELIAALENLQKQLTYRLALIDDLRKEIKDASRPIPAFSIKRNQGMMQYEDAARRLLKDRKVPVKWRASLLPLAAIALLLDSLAAPAASSGELQAQRFIDLLFADGSPFCASAFLPKQRKKAVLQRPALADFQKFLNGLSLSNDFEECCRCSGVAWQDDTILYLDYKKYWPLFLAGLEKNVVAGSQLAFQREVLAGYIIYAKQSTAKDPYCRPQYRRKDASGKAHAFLRLKTSIKNAR